MSILDIAKIQKVLYYSPLPSKSIKSDVLENLNIPLIYVNRIIGFDESNEYPRPIEGAGKILAFDIEM
jgi:hypothetical protein